MTNKNLESQVNEIANICIDGYEGYKYAADSVKNPEFKTIFNRMAQQRKLFVEEIKNECKPLGVDIEADGSMKGYFHRNWLSTKAFFSTSTDESIIESALKGEKEAVATYESAIKPDTPNVLKEKLENQYKMIKGAVHQLHGLEHEIA